MQQHKKIILTNSSIVNQKSDQNEQLEKSTLARMRLKLAIVREYRHTYGVPSARMAMRELGFPIFSINPKIKKSDQFDFFNDIK